MRKLFLCALPLLLTFGAIGTAAARGAAAVAPQTAAAASSAAGGAETAPRRRGPVFRASKDQITQAQAALKRGGHYGGEATGKLDPETRGALKKYQSASGLKETGTLNRATLEKMGIALTEKQKAM